MAKRKTVEEDLDTIARKIRFEKKPSMLLYLCKATRGRAARTMRTNPVQSLRWIALSAMAATQYAYTVMPLWKAQVDAQDKPCSGCHPPAGN